MGRRRRKEEGIGVLTGAEEQQPLAQKAQTCVGSICQCRFMVQRVSTVLQIGWIRGGQCGYGRGPGRRLEGCLQRVTMGRKKQMWQTWGNWLKCRNKSQGGIRPSSVFRPEGQHGGTSDRKQEAAGKRELMGGMRRQQQDIQVDTFSGRLEMRPEAWQRPGDAA